MTRPDTINVLPKYMVLNDVLRHDNQRLTIRMFISRRGNQHIVWATRTDGTWAEVVLSVMGAHELCGGPTFDHWRRHGPPDLKATIAAVIKQQGRVA